MSSLSKDTIRHSSSSNLEHSSNSILLNPVSKNVDSLILEDPKSMSSSATSSPLKQLHHSRVPSGTTSEDDNRGSIGRLSPLKYSNISQTISPLKPLTSSPIKKPVLGRILCPFNEENSCNNGLQISGLSGKPGKTMKINTPCFNDINTIQSSLAEGLFEIFQETDEHQERIILNQRALNLTSEKYCKKNPGGSTNITNEPQSIASKILRSNENTYCSLMDSTENLLGGRSFIDNHSDTPDSPKVVSSDVHSGIRYSAGKGNIDEGQTLLDIELLIAEKSEDNSELSEIAASERDPSTKLFKESRQYVNNSSLMKGHSPISTSSKSETSLLNGILELEEDKENASPL